MEKLLEIFDSRPYLFAISVCQIRSSNRISTFNPPPPGWAKLVLGYLITRQAGRVSHGKIAKLQRKCSRKTLFRSLNVQTLILLKGEKKTKALKKQRLMLGAQWDFGNPGSPQKPLFLPFWASSQSPARAALQQYCPCQCTLYSMYIWLFLCLYMHCSIIVIIMFMC